MKTFKDIKVGDKLFSITTNGDLNAIIIEDIFITLNLNFHKKISI